MAAIAMKVRFRGKVQGVSFRYYMKRFADENEVRGWVRNMEDGSVEGMLEGEETAIRRVIELCKSGNPSAHVTAIETSVQEYTGRYTSFVIR
ncbi:MAG: acylphosphatase [Methanomassiliicoccales archaeon]